ncbi:DEAD-domain-containing protein [Hymenopellis radicata]|nr:DEAD-domain-containing protein [Hymenopellis radicata]
MSSCCRYPPSFSALISTHSRPQPAALVHCYPACLCTVTPPPDVSRRLNLSGSLSQPSTPALTGIQVLLHRREVVGRAGLQEMFSTIRQPLISNENLTASRLLVCPDRNLQLEFARTRLLLLVVTNRVLPPPPSCLSRIRVDFLSCAKGDADGMVGSRTWGLLKMASSGVELGVSGGLVVGVELGGEKDSPTASGTWTFFLKCRRERVPRAGRLRSATRVQSHEPTTHRHALATQEEDAISSEEVITKRAPHDDGTGIGRRRDAHREADARRGTRYLKTRRRPAHTSFASHLPASPPSSRQQFLSTAESTALNLTLQLPFLPFKKCTGMSWLAHVGSTHLRQVAAFHCSTTVFKSKQWVPKGSVGSAERIKRLGSVQRQGSVQWKAPARRSTRKPKVEVAPEFAREALPHSVAPPDADADAEVSKGAPTTKNLLRPPKSGKSRWVHDLRAPTIESLRAAETFEPFAPRQTNVGYSRGMPRSSEGTEPRRSGRSNFRSERRGGESSRLRQSQDYNSDPFSDGIPNNISHTDNVPSAVLQNVSTSKDMSTSGEEGFSSPPLMPGLLSCLKDVLGPNAKPTPIQALSLQHLLSDDDKTYKEYLLASETGSGKSIAYLLPLLQSLKQSELDGSVNRQRTHALNPRALILAPTHELARQLATFAKSLIHEIKLRVLCASRANTGHKVDTFGGSARQMKGKLEALFGGKEFDVRAEGRYPVDVLVGTPMKLLEMVKGRGWDRRVGEEEKPDPPVESEGEEKRKFRKGRDIDLPTTGKTGTSPAELGLINVDWVVIDEADVLFDPDFQETTRLLLSEIAAQRGSTVPYYPDTFNYVPPNTETEPKPISYPFNLVLTSATIPSALSNYLNIHHPSHTRVASPKLHHLPASLQTEYVGWTGGNKLADIEKRIRRVWSEDSITRTGTLPRF